MIITNTETISQREIIEILRIARGGTVRARNVGRDIFSVLKSIIGGEIEKYTKLQAHKSENRLCND